MKKKTKTQALVEPKKKAEKPDKERRGRSKPASDRRSRLRNPDDYKEVTSSNLPSTEENKQLETVNEDYG